MIGSAHMQPTIVILFERVVRRLHSTEYRPCFPLGIPIYLLKMIRRWALSLFILIQGLLHIGTLVGTWRAWWWVASHTACYHLHNTPASNSFIYTHPSLVSTTTCFIHTSAKTSATAASTALLAKDAAAVPVGIATAKPTTVVVEVEVAVVSSVPLSPYEFQNGIAQGT